MSEKVYLNGQLLDMAHASVSVGNPGLLHGAGLFETLRTYAGKPFRLDQHVNRLRRSAAKLNFQIGDVLDQIPEALQQVLKANALTDARVRFTVTPPAAQDEHPAPTLLIAAQATAGYPPDLYEHGMTVCICNEWRQSPQDPLAGHKTTCYFPRLIALRDAQDKQCGEALWFTPDNHLAEGSMTNVFLVKNGRLRTPPLDTPVLPGITRAAVLELAGSLAIEADETARTIDDLLAADEVFLTNAVMELMPVTHIERHQVADGKPGPITRQLAQAYRKLATTP